MGKFCYCLLGRRKLSCPHKSRLLRSNMPLVERLLGRDGRVVVAQYCCGNLAPAVANDALHCDAIMIEMPWRDLDKLTCDGLAYRVSLGRLLQTLWTVCVSGSALDVLVSTGAKRMVECCSPDSLNGHRHPSPNPRGNLSCCGIIWLVLGVRKEKASDSRMLKLSCLVVLLPANTKPI